MAVILMKCVFIYNPNSGKGKIKNILRKREKTFILQVKIILINMIGLGMMMRIMKFLWLSGVDIVFIMHLPTREFIWKN